MEKFLELLWKFVIAGGKLCFKLQATSSVSFEITFSSGCIHSLGISDICLHNSLQDMVITFKNQRKSWHKDPTPAWYVDKIL